jgi:hypothetical protein
MKVSKDKRIVYWNRRAENPPEDMHTWYFLIINEPKMIVRIKQKIFEQLQPLDELMEYRSQTIRGQDLRVLCFSFSSPQTRLDFKSAYNGSWAKEQELYVRPGLDNLIDRLIS